MITIEQTLNILKHDQNFREVLVNGEYYYHIEGTSFDAITMIAGRFLLVPSFFVKGANFKKEYLEQAISNGLGFMSLKKIMVLVFLPSSSMISIRP